MPLKLRAVLLVSAALMLPAGPVAAIEPNATADALIAALARGSDSKGSYAAVKAEGENVVIEGLSLSRGADEPTITFAKTVIEAPAEGDNGVFQSPRMTFADGKVTGESTGSIAAATLTGVTVLDPAKLKGDGLGESILFATAEATDLRVSRSGEPGEIAVARVFAEAGNVVDNIAQDSRGTVEDLVLAPEFFASSAVKPETLGYEKLVLDISWDGSRDIAGGTMTLRDLNVSLEGGGDVSIAAVVGNLPDPRVLNDPNAKDAASKTKVHNLSVRYKDASLAGRILDYLAGQQGISRTEYVQQMSAAMPFLLAILNNPTFQGEIATAATAFLQDPQSLTVTLAPAEPISGDEILDLVQKAPQSLPERLKAKITANAPE
jgi:hypothetical protein